MLGYIKNPYDGDEWEEIIDNCYRLRYQANGYQKIHANFKGDAGIEGYTKSGIVYQCYCPEKQYTDVELWEKQRDKVTKDINKLITNGKMLKELGVLKIKEWHFVTPEQRDKRLLMHCETKRQEVLQKRDELSLDYIDEDFLILVKIGQDFVEEINKLVYLGKNKFDIRLGAIESIDYDECDSQKIDNIKRKIGRVFNPDDGASQKARYDKLVNLMVEYYLKGIKIKDDIKKVNLDLYEKIISVDTTFKGEVEMRCVIAPLDAIPSNIFKEIASDFEEELKKIMGDVLIDESIAELKWNLLSAWMADCPMDFY
ncbi:hypothetical protein [Turicibacter sanguinis]|uniref:hypothetical protein n=1 Tax=Turicibacter sanguinis TaxID=154288 RepID=UPI00241DF28B|nr:hypothetical protein [Turicibacter sanguinis]